MLTLEEVNAREWPCRRCKGRFRLALPADWQDSKQLAISFEQRGVRLMEAIRSLTGCTLTDAKGTMQHFARTKGTCHACAAPLAKDLSIVDCPRCRSLNLQLVSLRG